MHEAKEVISIIIRILQLQASVFTPQEDEAEAERFDQGKDNDENRKAATHILSQFL